MSKQVNTVLEVHEIHDYPKPLGGLRKFAVIEYEITKVEINRFYLYQKEELK